MNRQSCIDIFFKSKATSSPKLNVTSEMGENKGRKRNLSLIKPVTPTKSPKVNDTRGLDVVALGSDDEDILVNSPMVPLIDLTEEHEMEEVESDSSQSTVVYSPEKPIHRKIPCFSCTPLNELPHAAVQQTVQQSPQNIRMHIKYEPCFESPDKIVQTVSHNSQVINKSPQSREKFFSPTKKRIVVKRTPNKVKRSLTKEMSTSLASRILFEDDLYLTAREGMDDKTVFLLDIINKYLNEPSLKPLLDLEAQVLLTNCFQVVKPGMRLVCRLYWWKEGWYKKEQVLKICSEDNVPPDNNLFQTMMASLVEHKLIEQSSSHNMTFDDFIAILKKEDLKQICKELKLKKNSKQDAIEALKCFIKRTSNISHFLTGCTSSNSKRVLDMMCAKAGPCYKLSEVTRNTLYRLYILMYLGMDYNIIREKRLELTLIYDKINRETYPVDKEMELDNASVVFRTREEFERYITGHNIYEEYLATTDLTEKCNIVKQVFNLYKNIGEEEVQSYKSLQPWLQRYTPANLYVKILEAGIQDLKKNKTETDNLLVLDILSTLINQNLFRQHKKANWYAEKALVLHSLLSKYDEAAQVLLEGFKSDMSEEAKDSMRPRAKKIANQKNIILREHLKKELLEYATKETILENNLTAHHIEKQPMDRIGKRGKVKFETRTPDGRMVEEAEEYCIAHYLCTKEFTNGEHWEGRIVTTLFFLLFWDIIYKQPPGVRGIFLSHFQRYPLDLFTDSFYKNRKQIIDDWLSVIENSSEDKLLSIVNDAWSRRPEYELSVVSLGGVPLPALREVAACLAPRGLAAACRRLAADYRYAHSGFPDLTLWNTHTKRIKFVEVKTDSDKPSMKQIQWMQYLRDHGIETEFCYVGVNTMRQRCRTKKTEATVKTEP